MSALYPCKYKGCSKFLPKGSLRPHWEQKHKSEPYPDSRARSETIFPASSSTSQLRTDFAGPSSVFDNPDRHQADIDYSASGVDGGFSEFDGNRMDIDEDSGGFGESQGDDPAFQEPLQVQDFDRVERYPGAGLPVGEVDEYTLRAKHYWPFDNEEQWNLAGWLLFPNRLSASQITAGAVEKNAKWIKPGCGFKSLNEFNKRLELLPSKGGEWVSKNLTRKVNSPAWVPENVQFWMRDSLETLKSIVGDVRLAQDMKWAPEKIYNSKGERIYSELWTGDWWPSMQDTIDKRRMAGHHDSASSTTIIPIILTSDKTLLSHNAKAKAWPLFMTIGNISNKVRFVPGKHCAQLICMIPVKYGYPPILNPADGTGLETLQTNPVHRKWRREVIHQVIRTAMSSIESVMRTGIKMACADGKERLCFPVLCQHIGDMEEQWLITLTISPTCPKCHHRGKGDEDEEIELEWREEGDNFGDSTTPRTDYDACQCRLRYSKDPSFPLNRWGYHPEAPYSRKYPEGGILDAVGPDLLHQVSKCWYDYGLQKWFWPMMIKWWANKNTGKVKEATVKLEFDSRYALIPTFANCRRFPNGILDKGHPWAVFEQKAMMKVIVAILDGICPKEAITVMRDYLHMHMLSHYEAHTDESLEYLRDAIDVFFRNLRNPRGIFVQYELITPDYEPQKFHYLRHYPESVRSKGSLTSYSTDRTEIWHKPLKRAYQRSNKKEEEANRFILREQASLAAFQSMIYKFEETSRTGDGGKEDSDMELVVSGTEEGDDEGGTEIDADEFDDCESTVLGSTTFVWPKSHHTPIQRASDTEQRLSLAGFLEELRRFLRRFDVSYSNRDPRVWVFNSIKISYPSWLEDEVAVSHDSSDSGTSARKSIPPEYVIPSSDLMTSVRINANTFFRHDTVLVKFEQSVSRSSTVHTMSRRRVVQVLLLFKCRHDGKELELAYVSWFETVRMASDTASGMYLVKRTTKRSVIPVTDIECPVHLMPKFGSQMGEADKAKRAMDQAKEKDRLWRQSTNYKGTKTWNQTDFILEYYNEFWVNVWVARDLYKRIF